LSVVWLRKKLSWDLCFCQRSSGAVVWRGGGKVAWTGQRPPVPKLGRGVQPKKPLPLIGRSQKGNWNSENTTKQHNARGKLGVARGNAHAVPGHGQGKPKNKWTPSDELAGPPPNPPLERGDHGSGPSKEWVRRPPRERKKKSNNAFRRAH